ncbi:MAG: lysophospholipid acyltransferase family protein [Armatimonadetes bacterium]|nr:lysophospholipid acyltransferase family protein [Armatimonadota bacterium]
MTLKQRWRNVRPYILAPLIYLIARSLNLTWRIRVEGFDRIAKLPGGAIYAGWHGRTMVAASFFRKKGVWTIISQSKDGDMQDTIFRKFGFNTIRGSTGRGGVKAAIESIEVLKKGAVMAFTPDGPRGPSGIVQGGIMLMAKKSGAWLVPVGVSADRRWLVKTWDRYMVPKWFARCTMVFGEPFQIPSDASEQEVEAYRLRLEQEMHRLQDEAEAKMGHGSAEAAAATT